MTLLYVQGFEGFSSSADRTGLDTEFDFEDDVDANEVAIATGRVTGKAAQISNGNNTNSPLFLPVSHLSAEDDWVVGFAFRTTYNFYRNVTGGYTSLLQFLDANEVVQFTVIARAGTLLAYTGAPAASLIGVASVSLTTYVWHFLEVKAKIASGSSGQITLRVNEEQVFQDLTANTQSTSSWTYPTLIKIGNAGNDVTTEIDDIYICDDAGAVHNDFLGDRGIRRLDANATGTTENFTSSAVGDNYTFVDEADPDTNDYVESSTASDKDTYNFENVGAPAEIEAVSAKSYAQKTDAGTRTFVHVARSGGTTETDSSVIYPSAGSWRYYQSIYPTAPHTGVAWIASDLNGAEFGFKVNT